MEKQKKRSISKRRLTVKAMILMEVCIPLFVACFTIQTLANLTLKDLLAAKVLEGLKEVASSVAYMMEEIDSGEFTLDGNDLYTLVKQADESAKKLPCYLACGTQDFTYSMNVDFVKQLEELGFDITFQTGEGSHDWMYWNDALKHALNFFVSKTSGDDL